MTTDHIVTENAIRFDYAVSQYKALPSAESLLVLNMAAIPLIAPPILPTDEVPGRANWCPTDVPAAFGSDFSHIRALAGRELDSEEVRRLSGALGYALRQIVCGEELSEPTVSCLRDDDGAVQATVLEFNYDSTKTRRDDPDYAEAFMLAREYAFCGSPIRTTNRAGMGTKGTRLVQPIPSCTLAFSVR